jgi:cobalt-zinc-cadmium efflux system outer membrane protein
MGVVLAQAVSLDARAETLTWAQVKERAMKHSPAALQGKQVVRAAGAEAAGAGRWPRSNPVLTGTFETGAPFGHSDDRNFSVALEQELDVSGLAAAGANLGRRKVTSAEREAAVTRLEGIADAADAFFELDRAERALSAWTELETSFRLIASGAARAAGAGERPGLDAILAEADSAGATSDMSQARSDLARAQTRLGVVIAARDPASIHVATEDAVPPPDARSETELIATAERRRPELRLWQARRDEAEARRAFATRSVFPQPTIGIGVRNERFQEGREGLLGSPGGLSGFRHRSTILELRLAVPLPFFERNQAERARALADASTAGEQSELAAREVKATVLRARAAVQVSWVALQRWRALEPRLTEALTLLQKGYAAGQVSLFDTLAGVERVARARVRALDARTAYLKARADLARAVGEEP